MKRETDEEFVVRMRNEQKLALPLLQQLERALRMARSNCRVHRWRVASAARAVA